MNKIKEKLKKIFFTDEDEVQGDDFATKREMFYFAGMMVGVFVSIFAILFNPDIYQVYLSWAINDGNMALDLPLGIVLFVVGFAITLFFFFYEKKKKSLQN